MWVSDMPFARWAGGHAVQHCRVDAVDPEFEPPGTRPVFPLRIASTLALDHNRPPGHPYPGFPKIGETVRLPVQDMSPNLHTYPHPPLAIERGIIIASIPSDGEDKVATLHVTLGVNYKWMPRSLGMPSNSAPPLALFFQDPHHCLFPT